MRRDLREAQDLGTVLDKIEEVVRETLAPDIFHVIFLSPFLSRDLTDGSTPNAKRKFVSDVLAGKQFISARTAIEVRPLEPVLDGAGTLMAVAVNHDQRVLGVLEMESRKEGAFDPRWKEVLTYFAELITLSQETHERREQQRKLEEQVKLANLARTYGELAHRIGTSLSVIQQSAKELQRDGASETGGRRLQYISSHASRIEGVLRELKNLSVPRSVKVEVLNVADIVRSVIEEWQTCAADVEVLISGTEELRARADGDQLRDVIACLMKNAFEAIDARRAKDEAENKDIPYWIHVTCGSDTRRAEIRISDQGVGFDDVIQSRLFNPLFSTKNRRDNLNEGYGLYTSERVIKAMGGSIEGYSPGPYCGAEFTIRLQE
jgi:signal transduction histidine kinase